MTTLEIYFSIPGATLNFPNAATDTAVDGTDFDAASLMTMIKPATAVLNMDGTAVYQYTITHTITDDGDLENLKQFSVQLSYTGTLITASTEISTVWLQDNGTLILKSMLFYLKNVIKICYI